MIERKICRGVVIGIWLGLVSLASGIEFIQTNQYTLSTNESLSFTRGDARVCAVLRGLLDSITIESKDRVFTSVSGHIFSKKAISQQYVPSPLKYYLPSFINRSLRYFRVDKIDNVGDERKEESAANEKD